MMSLVRGDLDLPGELAASRRRQWADLRDLMAVYAARTPVESVAVVGNAPLEPDPARAAAVDGCDLVIRCNSLVLDAPAQVGCVGRRCDVVLISRSTQVTPWVFQDYRTRVYLIMQAGFTTFRRVRESPLHWPADLGALPVPNHVVTRPLADLLAPDREPGTVIPTTGTTGLFLAHELFAGARTVATGFSFLSDRSQSEWAHHAGGTTHVNDKHDLALEGALLQSWVEDGSVEFWP